MDDRVSSTPCVTCSSGTAGRPAGSGAAVTRWPTSSRTTRSEIRPALRAYARAPNRRLSDLARTFIDGTETLNGLIV